MFDFDIKLIILSMWITTKFYFDCSHVKYVDHNYKFFCFVESGRWWIYRIQSGNAEEIGG